jgi:aerobic-type carbon monoxide dehydrogenase small subunit (CoxS/CutS family)
MEEMIRFELNGKKEEILLDPNLTLLWVLRNQFGLTGTKFGCGEGYCNACTVIVENRPVQSCLMTMGEVNGKKVLTIEGLAHEGTLHPIQDAFIKHDAMQCGYCTPGMIMNAYGLLLRNPDPNREDIVRGMDHNLCRCGAHGRIIDAIEEAAAEMKGGATS